MFSLSQADVVAWVTGILWPFLRIGAMLMAAPLFGARYTLVRTRVLLGLLIAMLLAPVLPPPPAVDPVSPEGVLIGVQQIVIGVAMGFILHMVFSAATQAGDKVAMSMGLGFATMIDPTSGASTPVVSQHYLVMATLLFLVFDGHLVFLEVMAESFRILPVAVDGLTRQGLWQLVTWGTAMYAGALLIALPAMVALLVVNVAFGVVTRAAPQLNIFAVGFPMTLTLGFLLLLVTLPVFVPQLSDLLLAGFDRMALVLGGG